MSGRRAALLADLAKLHAKALQLVAELAALDAGDEARERSLEAREREQAVVLLERAEQAKRRSEPVPFAETCAIQDVIAAVSSFYHLAPMDLRTQDRHADVALARHVAFYLCRQIPRRPSFPTIGKAFGGRDHTTVIYGVKKIEHHRKYDPRLDAQIDILAQRLGLGLRPEPPAEPRSATPSPTQTEGPAE